MDPTELIPAELADLKLFTPAEVHGLTRINETTLRRKAGERTWPSRKISGQLLFSADDIRWIIAAHARKPAEPRVHTRKRRTAAS